MKRETRPEPRHHREAGNNQDQDEQDAVERGGWMTAQEGTSQRKRKRRRQDFQPEFGGVSALASSSSSSPTFAPVTRGLSISQHIQYQQEYRQQHPLRQQKQPRRPYKEEEDKVDEQQQEGDDGGADSEEASSNAPSPKDNKSLTARITFEMLQKHFDKPLAEAATQFGICTTAMKKIARKNGLGNWPFRHIVALQRSIASLENGLRFLAPEQQTKYLEQIEEQRQELDGYLTDPRAMGVQRGGGNGNGKGGTKQAGKGTKRKLPKLSETITLEMLRPHFEKPINEVASLLGVCPTLMKRICRQHKLVQWPYRHIVGLRKSIDSILAVLNQPQLEMHQRDAYNEKLTKQQRRLQSLLDDPATVLSSLAAGETWQDDSPLYSPVQPSTSTQSALVRDSASLPARAVEQLHDPEENRSLRRKSQPAIVAEEEEEEEEEKENNPSRGNAHTRLMAGNVNVNVSVNANVHAHEHEVVVRPWRRSPNQSSGASIASILNDEDTEE